jgi:hypothetical protein
MFDIDFILNANELLSIHFLGGNRIVREQDTILLACIPDNFVYT